MASAVPKPGEFFGHFRLLEQIGAGGMGVVFRARDQRLERDVAIKILQPRAGSDETARKRFHREALILSRLNHPNIEAIYDFQSEDGVDYLVMEYVPGVSLDDRVHAGALPQAEVISLGIQLARGLSAAHAQDIIHRDLKPGNLRVTADHTLKILDFGLAQLFVLPEQGALAETATILPSFSGTLPYLAPEQLKGDEPSVRSDIYSAGVVLYELATGVRPFPQQGSMLWDAIIHALPASPRAANKEFSPELEAVIMTCLEKDPQRRYCSAAELQSDLERIAAGEKVTATNERLQAAAGAKRKRRLGLLFAACLVLALAIVLLIWKWPPPPPKAEQKIMAVLPIETLGQDPDTNALGLGLTETLTAKLVQASDSDFIQVVSARDLRDKGVKTSEDARREFGTNLVLESSLQRSGSTVRINCSLVDSKTHRQLAAKTIEAQVTDAFGLQDKIVSAALDMLPTQINPEQRNQLAARPDTEPAAYEAYVRGRGYLQEYEKPENIDNAIAEFNQALKVDPNYAPAYAGLGEAYWIGYQQLNRGKQWLDEASSACEKALALGKQLSDAHACMGNVYVAKGQYGPAAAEFSRAVELNPDSDGALIGLADAYQKLGKLPEAEGTYKKAIGLRPNYWGVYSWLGNFYYSQARYAEAAAMFQKVTELAPDNFRGHSNLGGINNLQGKYQEAIQESQRSLELRPNADAYTNLGTAYFALRRYADAADSFTKASKLDDRNWVNWGNLGDALYWAQGSRPQAAAAYRKAIALAKAQLEVNQRDATAWAMVADYYAMLDEKAEAYKSIEKALSLAPADADVSFRAAIVYNHFGDPTQALSLLKKAVEAGFSKMGVVNQPDFETLKNNPQFKAVVGL